VSTNTGITEGQVNIFWKHHEKEVGEFRQIDNNTEISHKTQTESSILQWTGYTLNETLMYINKDGSMEVYTEDIVKWTHLVHGVATTRMANNNRMAEGKAYRSTGLKVINCAHTLCVLAII